MDNWTPISREPPKKSGTYICTCSDGTPRKLVTAVRYISATKTWVLTGARAYWKVKAWMPMPEPWEGET